MDIQARSAAVRCGAVRHASGPMRLYSHCEAHLTKNANKYCQQVWGWGWGQGGHQRQIFGLTPQGREGGGCTLFGSSRALDNASTLPLTSVPGSSTIPAACWVLGGSESVTGSGRGDANNSGELLEVGGDQEVFVERIREERLRHFP